MPKIKNIGRDIYRGSGLAVEAGATATVTDVEAEYLTSVFGERFKLVENADPAGRPPKRKQVRGPRRKR